MTLAHLINPIQSLKKINKSYDDNANNLTNHDKQKKQADKDFGDSMQKALGRNNPIFIEDEIEKKKLKSKLQHHALLNKLSMDYKNNQR